MDGMNRVVGRTGVRAAAIAAALLGCALTAAPAAAQTWSTAPATGAQTWPAAPVPPGDPSAAAAPRYTPAQLDQMLAPLALYPDDLLGQILMAATYPLEIVEADRWLQQPANASLHGTALAQALQSLPWDASVKSLMAYPPILAWLDSGVDWTGAVGEAFLAQQADVMDSVQRLRARAKEAGRLSSTPQQMVTTSGQDIEIASPDPNVLYVPVYDTDTVYGPWPYSDYPPYDFAMPGYSTGTFIVLPILVGYWGWERCDWRHHRIDIVAVPGSQSARHVAQRPSPQQRPVAWQHDPAHRQNVPYNNPLLRARFESLARPGQQGSHHSQPGPTSQKPPTAPSATEHPARPEDKASVRPPQSMTSAAQPAQVLRTQQTPQARWSVPAWVPPAPPHPAPALAETPGPPVAQSPPHAPEVRAWEPRGAVDRAPAPADAPRR